jgi:hypothetical protein
MVQTDEYVPWTQKYMLQCFQEGKHVLVCVRRIDRGDFTPDDEKEVKDMLEDLGEWEDLIRTGLSLIEDLGLKPADEAMTRRYKEPTRVEKCDIKYVGIVPPWTEVFRIAIHLRTEEMRRRAGTSGAEITLPAGEIFEQLRNLPKWQTLMRAVSSIR